MFCNIIYKRAFGAVINPSPQLETPKPRGCQTESENLLGEIRVHLKNGVGSTYTYCASIANTDLKKIEMAAFGNGKPERTFEPLSVSDGGDGRPDRRLRSAKPNQKIGSGR